MATKKLTKKLTLRERLNDVAEELETKAQLPRHGPSKTASEALDRIERAVRKL